VLKKLIPPGIFSLILLAFIANPRWAIEDTLVLEDIEGTRLATHTKKKTSTSPYSFEKNKPFFKFISRAVKITTQEEPAISLKELLPFDVVEKHLAIQLRDHLAIGLEIKQFNPRAYRENLKHLKQNPIKASQALIEEYHHQPEERYYPRWLLVHTVREINHPASKEFYVELLNSEIPKEQETDTHLSSTVENELVIRLAAIHGLEELAKSGNTSSTDELLYVALKHPHRPVRTEAILAYISLHEDQEEAKTKLRDQLSKMDLQFLEIKRVGAGNIKEVLN